MGQNIYISGREFIPLLSAGNPFDFPLWELYHITSALKGTQKPSIHLHLQHLNGCHLLLPILSWPILEKVQSQGTYCLYIFGHLWQIGNFSSYWEQNLSLWFPIGLPSATPVQKNSFISVMCVSLESNYSRAHRTDLFRISLAISGQTWLVYSAIPCDILSYLGHSFVNCSPFPKEVARYMEKAWPS